MTELKACDYCQSDEASGYLVVQEELIPIAHVLKYFVECENCMAKGPRESSPEDAIISWNSRPEKDRLQAEVERLNKAGEELTGWNYDLRDNVRSLKAENEKLLKRVEELEQEAAGYMCDYDGQLEKSNLLHAENARMREALDSMPDPVNFAFAWNFKTAFLLWKNEALNDG